ncbi:MAG: Bax inhibitor-1/YccA family protein [Hyphomonadaceae bacterium]|nr:Bax inhibitor-1/YccA family protein [Hyphomonadaceae bacterium]
MNEYTSQARSIPTGRADMATDAGLRSFMLGVYNKMALGLLLSAVLAFVAGTVPAVTQLVFGTPLMYVVMFGPIAILLISAFTMKNPSPTGANLVYWSVVSLIGIGMGALLIVYGGRVENGQPTGMYDIGKAFLVTSGAFGALSLWGYTTKRDLTGWGSFLMMGLFGLILASLVNFGFAAFTGAPIEGLSFAISVIGVLVFAGLTAYDTQRLKFMYYQLAGDERSMAVATTYGALNLYLNFINLFQFILSLIGNRE